MSQNQTEIPDTALLARKLLAELTGSWVAQATHVAAELGIADLLADGPRTSEDLAAATGTHAPSLHRLLRALVTIDICRERDDDLFEITPKGSLLRADAPGSLRSFTLWWGAYLWPVWGNLLYSVRTGKSARALLTGTEGFAHLERDPRAAAVFNQALVELTRLSCAEIVRAYDFSGLKRIVDVGGGYGQLLAAILESHPETTGVLFDLPHAIDGAKAHFATGNLLHRCEFIAGDFFASVPEGDAHILKSVIHDWNDERARKILENSRRALGGGGHLLLVEQVLPDRMADSRLHQSLARSDLTMLVAHGAGERTEAEFRQLLDESGFELARIIPAGTTFSLLDALPHP